MPCAGLSATLDSPGGLSTASPPGEASIRMAGRREKRLWQAGQSNGSFSSKASISGYPPSPRLGHPPSAHANRTVAESMLKKEGPFFPGGLAPRPERGVRILPLSQRGSNLPDPLEANGRSMLKKEGLLFPGGVRTRHVVPGVWLSRLRGKFIKPAKRSI